MVVGLDKVLRIVSRPRADPLTRRAGYVVMVTRLGWQSCCTGLDAVSPLFDMLNRGNFHLRPQVLSPGAKRLRCGMAPLTAEADDRPHY